MIVLVGAIFAAGMLTYRFDLPPVPQIRALRNLAAHFSNGRPTSSAPIPGFRVLREERRSGDELSAEEAKEIRKLESIGYVSGSTPTVARVNVTRFDLTKAHNGLNLYTDGHAAQATLMDMRGKILHQWDFPFLDAYPGWENLEDARLHGFWRRVALTETGDLFAIYEGLGLIKIDAQSNLVWTYPGRAHHDLEIQPDGTLYILTRKAEMIPKVSKVKPILHDFIVILDPEGQELRRVSILNAIESSNYAAIIKRFAKGGDVLHTNTIEVLKGNHKTESPAFRAGNVLVSWPYINTIGIIDMTTGKLVWALSDLWQSQHQPTFLENGRLLLFDNQGDRGKSRVLEFDPFTQEIHWSYRGSKTGFFSATCGSNQRLGNGNTLITETGNGRAFEVTQKGEIVWEFYTPNRAGDNGTYIAALFEVVRLPADFPMDWAAQPESTKRPQESDIEKKSIW